MSQLNAENNSRERRHFSPAAKVAILRQHFLEGKAISEICQNEEIAVTQFL
ncbi:transposase [Telmatocola sphagniphila]|uniref:Transposase n=1 Tax=Telmatocola sphagniphila TaxID=1123043 RepID=A0A8E6ESW8_9BACT|nr:transposase [Telmatocola sphagniphila]QVL31519.1 transposase [Telmatocola sphagniphila]